MSSKRVVLPALLFSILTAVVSAGQPTFTPQAGVLLLRNGQVLHGEITRVGDYFVVMLGPASEIRLKADEVETACKSLDEAYLHRLRRLDPTAHAQRIALAEWCLRNQLLDQAGEQLDLATQQIGEHPQIASLRERLKFAREPKPQINHSKALANLATIGTDQLEKKLHELPDGAVEKFSAVIQPILLNRCGANQCHGPVSKSDYQLLKPALGQVANQRYSQRNLYSTLLFVERDDPLGSPLLVMPQRRHGSAREPVFDERTREQLEELSNWVMLATATKATAQLPQKIDVSSTLLTAGHHPQTDGRMAQPPTAAGTSETAPKPGPKERFGAGDTPPSEEAATNVEVPKTTSFAPRDAFDPEIFNRRFFPKK